MDSFRDRLIKMWAGDNYEDGKAIYENGEVINFKKDSFWKTEADISADIVEQDEKYHAQIKMNESDVLYFHCDCKGHKLNNMCKHLTALLMYESEQKKNDYVDIISSPVIKSMIVDYTNKVVAKTINYDSKMQYGIELHIHMINGQVKISFDLVGDRKYHISNLSEFAECFEQYSLYKLSAQTGFYCDREAFNEESVEMLDFILNMINMKKELSIEKGRNLIERGEILLGSYEIDCLFEIIKGKEILYKKGYEKEQSLRVVSGNPRIAIELNNNEDVGFKLVIEKCQLLTGANGCYIIKDDNIYITDEAFRTGMREFIRNIKKYNEYEYNISRKDLTGFMSQVAPVLTEYTDLNISESIDIEKYSPPKLTARFYIDNPEPNLIVCTVQYDYGENVYNPLDDFNNRNMDKRDLAMEYRIHAIILKYFKVMGSMNDKTLVIYNDYEQIYNFLENGVSELASLGEVNVSDAFKQMKITSMPVVKVGISVEGNLLDLNIDIGDMKKDELVELLKNYKLKKKYYRLRTGEYIKIEDTGLSVLSEMSDALNISSAELGTLKISVPKYRAFYMDELLKTARGLEYSKSNEFRKIIRNLKIVDDSDYEVPESLKNTLRAYQANGFKWLKTIDSYGLCGILADDMGLGKTIQIMTLLLYEKENNKDSYCPSLIVTPASLIYNWESEIEKFAPQLKTLVVVGTISERRELMENIDDYDVLITSYDLLRRDIDIYKDKEFRYQIIDEAQFIKNYATQSAKAVKIINAKTRFALTGTPIENKLSELWSIFDYLMPGFLYSYSKFKSAIEMPIVKENSEVATERFGKMIGPFVLRRLKSDVLKDLPDKIEKVTYAKLDNEQYNLYAANVEKIKGQLRDSDDASFNNDRIQILAEITKLRQICCDPSLCYDNYNDESAKLEVCMELIKRAIEGNHKILLFSQFTSMLDIISRRLREEKIDFYTITGSTPKERRSQLVSEFNHDDTPVFLLSLKAAGTGLNLTSADIVIHYDPWWNQAAELQATDRAHRIGQKNTVSVYKIIAKDTIEEKILELQEKKKNLADSVIREGNITLNSLSRENLLEILG